MSVDFFIDPWYYFTNLSTNEIQAARQWVFIVTFISSCPCPNARKSAENLWPWPELSTQLLVFPWNHFLTCCLLKECLLPEASVYLCSGQLFSKLHSPLLPPHVWQSNFILANPQLFCPYRPYYFSGESPNESTPCCTCRTPCKKSGCISNRAPVQVPASPPKASEL